ncbi:IS21 family transposase [Sorangium sp. So ce388]|uniref:IS21 family transposase n=1 Tax=Sorangium sp. So ce388 TaxID=3133309 RepID=UPI003F5B9BA6
MIGPDREAEILRLFHAEKWPIGTIAAQLGHHHGTVRRVLTQAGAIAAQQPRRSIADPFVPFLVETLAKYPRLCASRLYTMLKARGYPGGPDHFRAVVARHRPRPPAEAFLRLRMLPGEQAQVDWAHFGKLTVGAASRPLVAFVMVLSFSRQLFLRFFSSAAMPAFLRGHVDAFAFFGGVPRVLLYDNLKSAVLERAGDAIRFHPTLLELAAHYHYQPRPVAPARGNEKGRVERAIRYVRDAFFAARAYTDLDDLNAQALAWAVGEAGARRCAEERSRTVRDVFAEERGKLLPLPGDDFAADERVEVAVGKTPYVRFDLNDYSVPHTHVRRTLVVVASEATVRVLDGTEVIARHARSYDRGRQIEDPAHLAALVEAKRQGREHRTLDRLHHLVPSSRELLRAVAERGGNVGNTTFNLSRLLDAHAAEDVDTAVAEALARGTPHVGAVRQSLDRRRHERGEPPPVSLHLPASAKLDSLVVRPHALSTYDQLRKATDDDR